MIDVDYSVNQSDQSLGNLAVRYEQESNPLNVNRRNLFCFLLFCLERAEYDENIVRSKDQCNY